MVLFLFLLTFSEAESQIDNLITKSDNKALVVLLKKVKVIYDESELPDNSKEFDLIIVEDDYGVQSLYELTKGIWNDRSDKIVNQILNKGQGASFSFVSSSKGSYDYLETETKFSEYTSDKTHLFVEIIASAFKQDEIKNEINKFLQAKNISVSKVINVQIEIDPIDKKLCNIIIIYSY